MNRQIMVVEARSWIGTPYILGQGCKGAGVDCARLIAECLVNCGLSEREDLGFYSHDWFHHTTAERYLRGIMKHARKTLESIAYRNLEIEPGCIVATRAANSPVINHSGIVTEWPMLVHAVSPYTQETDATRHPMWSRAKIEVFDPFK